MEELDRWIRATLEACQERIRTFDVAGDLLPLLGSDHGSIPMISAAVAAVFLTSIAWNWSSPSVRWAFQQYLHAAPSATAQPRRLRVSPALGLLYVLYLVQNSAVSVFRVWNRLLFSVSFHLPPLAFCLLMLAPYSRIYYSNDLSGDGSPPDSSSSPPSGTAEESKHLNRAARFVLDELSTRCFSLVAVLVAASWAHEVVFRKRRIVDLPLPPEYRDLDRALLPPFLPEDDDNDDEVSAAAVYREAVMEYLVSLQEIKSDDGGARSDRQRRARIAAAGESDANGAETLGYAVVTGASRGIGRAIAVELARYGFPLVLVARDRDRLTLLAKDLRDCYGTHCCVIAYDLAATSDAAEKVYDLIVNKAGLKVDVLVNNAGIALQGISVDLNKNNIDTMIALNVSSVSSLTHLFGRDMKDRRRGRILIVSSICGLAAGIASVAVYSATKAFERSFSNSLSLEMEPFGVGVTCLIPGAVRDTDFRTRTRCGQALVWKLPFCSSTSPPVAAQGVRAMLRGETEVIVGLVNRIFVKVLQPLLPQRLHNLVATLAWNPIHIPFFSSLENATYDGSSARDRTIVSVDPRVVRARYDSDVLVLDMEGWAARRGWRTETGRFDDLMHSTQAVKQGEPESTPNT